MSAPIDPRLLSDPTQLGRLLTRLENEPDASPAILAALPAPAAPVHRIGVTGSPGVGKSTLIRGLIRHYRGSGERVGVVAVDPTSPLTGGAILGDRVRMGDTQGDEGVFIRSLGSRGSLGGVTPGASAVASVLESAGYGRILIETVGVGQTGYDVINLADTVVALFSPESGDGVQLLKAGILEIGDIFAVNKSDRPGADLMLKEIIQSFDFPHAEANEALHHGSRIESNAPQVSTGAGAVWQPPAVRLIASEGEGVDAVATAIEEHRRWLSQLPPDHPRRRRRIVRELGFVMRARLSRLLDVALAERVDSLASRVCLGEIAIWEALQILRSELLSEM